MEINNLQINVALDKNALNNLLHLYAACFAVLALNIFNTANAQIAEITNSCYTVHEGGSQPNYLYKYNQTSNSWSNLGNIIPGSKIEAIAIDPVSNILYAVDKNIFGTINQSTLVFTSLSFVGDGMLGYGAIGNQLFDDIDGLTYDPYTETMWATHRRPGNVESTNDLLLQINPKTGKFIKGAFESGHDYAVVTSVFDGTLNGEVYDVDDIAYNPYNKKLYAIQNQEGPGVISEINPFDGGVESVLLDMNEDDIEGLGISSHGELFGTVGDHGSSASAFVFIDINSGSTQNLPDIDPTKMNNDFEAFDCKINVFDLALRLTGSPNFYPGGNVTFTIAVTNQGGIEVDYYELTAYLPIGLTLNDNGWSQNGSQKIKTTLVQKILPGQTKTKTVQLKVANNAASNLTLAAEISNFYNFNVNKFSGRPGEEIALPDIDSTPDNLNNETQIKDDAIYQGGPKTGGDEDDHDIINISEGFCEVNLNITGNIDNGSYAADETIVSDGIINNSNAVSFKAGNIISLGKGFSADTKTQFEIMIKPCP